jgi:uncharacterized linocin/CFP29 family protein
MEHILMREDAPLEFSQWELIDKTVQQVAGKILVGRRFLNLYGPVGFGAYTVPLYTYAVGEDDPVRANMTTQLPLALIKKDFVITAQDLELFNAGQPFDIAPVAAAAAFCAYAEDELVLGGLFAAEGLKSELGDWSSEGQALVDISKATSKLTAEGLYGPYAVVMNPLRYSLLQRVAGRRGILESELVAKVAEAGLYQSPSVPEDKVLVISPQPQYVDLAVGLDLVTGFLETADFEHHFRVMEKVALRVKDGRAICVLA